MCVCVRETVLCTCVFVRVCLCGMFVCVYALCLCLCVWLLCLRSQISFPRLHALFLLDWSFLGLQTEWSRIVDSFVRVTAALAS